MDNFSITQYGRPLSKDKYSIDRGELTFSSIEEDLVLDFTGLSHWTFTTYSFCTFITGDNCTFNTETNGTFKTGSNCTFNTEGVCIFITSNDCTFTTGGMCIFLTGDSCIFDTNGLCTFNIYDINSCKFKSFDGHSTILDRNDKKRYVLNDELKKMLKVMNG